MKYLFGMSFFLAACANKEDCVSGQDSDADGLDDCVELEMGTDANLADSDGDGFTETDGDCNDTTIAINPDAVEICGTIIDSNDCINSKDPDK